MKVAQPSFTKVNLLQKFGIFYVTVRAVWISEKKKEVIGWWGGLAVTSHNKKVVETSTIQLAIKYTTI